MARLRKTWGRSRPMLLYRKGRGRRRSRCRAMLYSTVLTSDLHDKATITARISRLPYTSQYEIFIWSVAKQKRRDGGYPTRNDRRFPNQNGSLFLFSVRNWMSRLPTRAECSIIKPFHGTVGLYVQQTFRQKGKQKDITQSSLVIDKYRYFFGLAAMSITFDS
jgi:hypothetical protein